jgi:hypothetical protein
VGNNGATTAAQIFNSGQVSIGNYASPTNLRLVTIGQDTAFMSFGSLVGATSSWAFYGGVATPSSTNYTLNGDGTSIVMNAGATGAQLFFRVADSNRLAIANNKFTFTPSASTTGAITNYNFSVTADTGQTASTEISNFKVNGASKTWANGGGATTIATQRWNYFTANTANTSGGGSLNITDSFANYAEIAIAGTASITNSWGFGTNGGIKIVGVANTVLANAALATNATTGFLHVPSCAGTPTGVPTLFTGTIPVVVDSTNNKMYIYSGGAWVALN